MEFLYVLYILNKDLTSPNESGYICLVCFFTGFILLKRQLVLKVTALGHKVYTLLLPLFKGFL